MFRLSEKSKIMHVRLTHSVKKLLPIILFILFSLVFTQERYNFLSINGATQNELGPYYFVSQGNSKDAYVDAQKLADVLSLEVLESSDELRLFSANWDIRFDLTQDIMAGLEKTNDALSVNNTLVASPKAIKVEDVTYIALGPVSEALGLESGWQADSLTVTLNGDINALASTPDAPTAVTPASTSTTTQSENTLSPPRVGLQENGSSRVVIELPPGSQYALLVKDKQFVIQFLDARVSAFSQEINDDNIERIEFAKVNGEDALVVNTQFDLNASGLGFKRGALAATETNPNERLFIDFAPDLESEAITEAVFLSVEPLVAGAVSTVVPSQHKKIVVIDAGHGGKDPGAVSDFALEKEVALSTSLKVRDILERAGIEVVMTRQEDAFIDLETRAQSATPETNFFVSIHANSVSEPAAHGIETFIFGEPLDNSLIALAIKENGGGEQGRALTDDAKNFANSIQGQLYQEAQLQYSKSLAEVVQSSLVTASSARDRGVKQNYLHVLRRATSPAILVELGFISNPDEGSKLATEAYQELLAQAIAQGIIDFLTQGGLRTSAEP